MKKKIWTIGIVLIITVLIILLVINNNKVVSANISYCDVENVIKAGSYDEYLQKNNSVVKGEESLEISPNEFNTARHEYLTSNTEGYQEASEVFYWLSDSSSTISFEVEVESAGLYVIELDYFSKVTTVIDIELQLAINNQVPFDEATQIILDTLWTEEKAEASTDRYGNDVNMLQVPYQKWQSAIIKDPQKIYKDGYQFALQAGKNTISLTKVNGELLLGKIRLFGMAEYLSYEEYRGTNKSADSFYKCYEAEQSLYKSSSTIIVGTSRDVGVTPFSTMKLKLNVIGNDSWNISGDRITWNVNVPQSGFYYITLKALQTVQNTTSYRTLYVNGEIPFEEAKHLAFSYQNKWQNVTLQGMDGSKYEIYLEAGDNTLTLEVDSTLYKNISARLSKITTEMTNLGLDITKFTNGNTSSGIDWDLEKNFTTIKSDINGWITELKDIISCYRKLAGFNKTTTTSQDLLSAISKLEKILTNIDALPRRLSLLSEGSSCAAQLVAGQIDNVLIQSLVLDAIYIHTEDAELPKPKSSFIKSFWVNVKRFFLSIFDDTYDDKGDKEEVVVWLNLSRKYVDILQKLTDDVFTGKTGIKVKVSVMSDDGKLILANSADQQPDVALGVSAWIPNDYGMRGMLYDLRQFDDYLDVIENYNSEQLVPMTYDNSLYGLPQTENFYVLFYRKDILNELSLTVPNTWDDVIDMLPVLKRYGMDFYIPLSSSSSAKSFDATTPFIYQFGGEIYSINSEGMLTGGLDNENTIKAMEFITDLYTEYGIPYQVSSFFNELRYSRIPIGIADFSTYLTLLNAAPEIKGLWDIAVVPGVASQENPEVINRFMPGAATAGVIFEKSDKLPEAWEFMKWWMSTEIQTLYAETMVNTLGSKFLWNTANVEAFKNLSWNKNHKQVILEQWTHLKEVSRVPGYYIVEREISNTWNSVVYNDANLRSTLSDAMIKINKEITRKMKEFGYVSDAGKVIREYDMPTPEKIDKWKENRDDAEKQD